MKQEIEKYFIIDEFEDGWGIDELYHEELLYDYCQDALFIPVEYIEELTMKSFGLEIYLTDLTLEDIYEDWYSNLFRLSTNTSKLKYTA